MTVDTTREREKEYEANDPVVGANTTAQDEPTASLPITTVERDPEKDILDDEKKGPAITSRSPSVFSTTDSDSNPDATNEKKPKKKWSKSLNPLKRNPPPVPESRRYSREKDANWFSRLTFQWMQPIMTAS